MVILDGHSIVPDELGWKNFSDSEHISKVDFYDNTPFGLVVERCRGAELVLTNKVVIDSDTMDRLPELRYIGVLATGYNVVDINAAARRGIVVTNIPAYSTESVVQMTWAHILNIYNQVGHYASENSRGRWCGSPDFCYWDSPLHELSGKTIGIVGLGNIGRRVADVALAFGMKVLALTGKSQESLPGGITKVVLDRLLKESDIVTLHCPLTSGTREMINRGNLAMMKSDAVLVNTGRGGLVSDADLADALNAGRIAAYGADVLTIEPARPDNPLVNARNCYLTPHIAWATVEARQRLIAICMENVRAFIEGHPVNVIHADV